MGTSVLKKNFIAVKKPLAFITYRRYSQNIKYKLSKIRLVFIAIQPVLYNIEVLVFGKKYAINSKILFKAINQWRVIRFKVSSFKAFISSNKGI